MNKLPGMVLALLVSVPALAGSVTVTSFGGQDGPRVLEVDSPGTVIVEVPAGAWVESAVVDVRPLPAGEPSAYPVSPAIIIDGAVVWAFNGTGYGPFGEQNVLSDGSGERTCRFDERGGAADLTIRLPAGARVEEARLEVACNGTTDGWTDSRFIGPGPMSHLGFSMAPVGDVNGDGLDDFLIGAPDYDGTGDRVGMAVLYYGDPGTGGRPGLVITGSENGSRLGYSVSGAGDIDRDGFADFLVGAPGDPYGNNGITLVFLGGTELDALPEITLSGVNISRDFGHSVSGGGDVNGDGYDDIVVCAPGEYSGCFTYAENYTGHYVGLTYVYYGGPGLDGLPDVQIVNYNYTTNHHGAKLKTAELVGDANGDGFDDILVLLDRDYYHGRCPHTGPEYYARAALYFGAAQMDPAKHVSFVGENDYVASSFSAIGDINSDGFDDLLLTEVWNRTSENLSGVASIYLGKPAMDAETDTVIPWGDLKGGQGLDASRAGDLNGDGADDAVLGVGFGPLGNPTANGRALVYTGGAAFDTEADAVFTGSYPMDFFGGVVSSAGDVDQDGQDELLVAAAGDNTAGNQAGLVHLYNPGQGLVDPWLRLGDTCATGSNCLVWEPAGLLRTREWTRDFSADLTDYLRNAGVSGRDAFGCSYVEVPFSAGAAGAGNLTVTGIRIRYNVTALVPDMAAAMNRYLSAHRSRQMESLQIPIYVTASTPARFRLSGLNLTYALAPRPVKPVPDLFIDEESIGYDLLDAWEYFEECDGRAAELEYSFACVTGGDLVSLALIDGRYLAADARTGPASANWTGTVTARLVATDHHGFRTESNIFRIDVRNVQDPPVITSAPPGTAGFGHQYVYEVESYDGDGDALRYGLEARPPGMVIDSATGLIHWYPASRGSFEVSVEVSDGKDTAWQNFTVDVWKNTSPVILGEPPAKVFAGARYVYEVLAFDEERDPLGFELRTAASGLTIDSGSGRLSWTPAREQVGHHPVAVAVTDCFGGRAVQYFTIEVLDDRPRCTIGLGAGEGALNSTDIVRGQVERGAFPVLRVEVRVDGSGWLPATGTGRWSFDLSELELGPGDHILYVRAFDGNYSEAVRAGFAVNGAVPVPGVPNGRPAVSPVPVLLLALFIAVFAASGRRVRRRGRQFNDARFGSILVP